MEICHKFKILNSVISPVKKFFKNKQLPKGQFNLKQFF